MIVESAQIDWIKGFLKNVEADWKTLVYKFCKKENLQLYLQANFDEKDLPRNIPQYYLDAIRTWRSIKYDDIKDIIDLGQQLFGTIKP